MEKCRICKVKEATKTNSHLLPAFLEAVVGSYDRSYKRDKDILITKTVYDTKIHVGNIPSTENDRLFDQDELTDERINRELKDNPCAVDYVFCPDCESALSTVLETPYSSLQFQRLSKIKHPKGIQRCDAIGGDRAFFFWLSVIWRMSLVGFGYSLPKDIDSHLSNSLAAYLKVAKDDKETINEIIAATPFSYKLFYCQNYCKDPEHGGMIHCWLSDSKKSIVCIIGDLGIEACFSRDFKSEAPEYFLDKTIIESAPVNLGVEPEQIQVIDKGMWNNTHKEFIKTTKNKILSGHIELLQCLWENLKQEGTIIGNDGMPDQMLLWILEKMYSDEDGVKMGDKFRPERWHHYLCEALENPSKWITR